jgi:hypothetical protein
MIKKENVLNEIIKYYITSNDFNGLPIYQMEYYNYKILCKLIDDGLIEVLSEKEVINPHIKGFDLNISAEKQKENISKRANHSVLYPTLETLKSVSIDHSIRLRKNISLIMRVR